ncbi:MAG TPA: hypothetical protein VFL80_07665 [Thermoanaerobaculia bacterium]|nr:hypothetical protein [Thermoanaerobaculia bacterium]
MIRRTFVLLLALALTGCALGPKVDSFAPARSAAGIEASLALDGGASAKGELLAVEETALVLLNQKVVTRVPYSSIRSGTFPQSGVAITNGRFQNAESREKLRLLSRFPQGLTPPLLASLLAAYGQEAIAVLPR